MGELARLTRMVQRRDLKTQLKLCKQIMATHQPLVKAMDITAKAHADGLLQGQAKGYNEGFKAALETLKAEEQAVNAVHDAVVNHPPVSAVPPCSTVPE